MNQHRRLLQINPVMRCNTSTGRIMQEIGELAMEHDWESYIAYSGGRDGYALPCSSQKVPVGGRWSVAMHGLTTRLLDRHGLASAGATRQFIEDIERINPDIIHIHNIHGYFLHYPTLFSYLAQSNRKVVWTIHDCWLYTGHCYYYDYVGCNRWQTGCGNCPQRGAFPRSWWRDRSAKNFADKRQAFTSLAPGNLTIVPVSEWLRKEMSKSFLSQCQFRVIHNGIDTNTFSPQINNSEALQRYGLTPFSRIYLGVASIWSREKGLDDFVRMAEMLTNDEAIVLVGVDNATAARLPKRIHTISRTDNVGQLAQLYSAATAFLNPTWQDNYPTVNLEAISCGTPVVTYRTGGSVESITPSTGRIVEQGDTEAMLTEARKFASATNADQISRECREYALTHFRKEDRYLDYINLYEELLTQAQPIVR